MSEDPSAVKSSQAGVEVGNIPWWRLVGIGASLVAGIAAGTFLIVGPQHFAHDAGLRLDVVKVWLTLVAGYGAGVTLWLSLRRQAHHERDTAQQRDLERTIAESTRADAADRRDAELYVAATTQLASPQPAVRLAGIHSFDRVGERNADFRQTITDVICAYLRMPPPKTLITYMLGETTEINDAMASELEVRLTAQRLLIRHRHPAQTDVYWNHLDVDLSRAHLHNFQAEGATWNGDRTLFVGATFSGESTSFGGGNFSGEKTWFDRSTFRAARTSFVDVTFAGESTSFVGAIFSGESTSFNRATFGAKETLFIGASFSGISASFDRATCTGELPPQLTRWHVGRA